MTTKQRVLREATAAGFLAAFSVPVRGHWSQSSGRHLPGANHFLTHADGHVLVLHERVSEDGRPSLTRIEHMFLSKGGLPPPNYAIGGDGQKARFMCSMRSRQLSVLRLIGATRDWWAGDRWPGDALDVRHVREAFLGEGDKARIASLPHGDRERYERLLVEERAHRIKGKLPQFISMVTHPPSQERVQMLERLEAQVEAAAERERGLSEIVPQKLLPTTTEVEDPGWWRLPWHPYSAREHGGGTVRAIMFDGQTRLSTIAGAGHDPASGTRPRSAGQKGVVQALWTTSGRFMTAPADEFLKQYRASAPDGTPVEDAVAQPGPWRWSEQGDDEWSGRPVIRGGDLFWHIARPGFLEAMCDARGVAEWGTMSGSEWQPHGGGAEGHPTRQDSIGWYEWCGPDGKVVRRRTVNLDGGTTEEWMTPLGLTFRRIQRRRDGSVALDMARTKNGWISVPQDG